MKKNMGSIDKSIRIVLAAAVAILFFVHILTGIIAIVLLIVAAIFLITSIFGFCPLYLPFGLSTKKKNLE